jgi:hypothetical protein
MRDQRKSQTLLDPRHKAEGDTEENSCIPTAPPPCGSARFCDQQNRQCVSRRRGGRPGGKQRHQPVNGRPHGRAIKPREQTQADAPAESQSVKHVRLVGLQLVPDGLEMQPADIIAATCSRL